MQYKMDQYLKVQPLDIFEYLGIGSVGVSREEVMGNSIRINSDIESTIDFFELT